MYDLIAEKYSSIFPLDYDRAKFVVSYFPKNQFPLLDIGCATGDLSLKLFSEGYSIKGIDLNEKMISIAKSRLDSFQRNHEEIDAERITFQVLDMRELEILGKFQGLLCFGNTLPHLKNENQLESFLGKCYKSLYEKGTMIIQILNYDKILREKKKKFPEIETDGFIFRREYVDINEKEILFSITIKNKQNMKVFRDETILYPITQELLTKKLSKSGFDEVYMFRNYAKEKIDLNENATLYVATRN